MSDQLSPSFQSVRVHLEERSYDIELGTGNLSCIGDFLSSFHDVGHVVVLTDQNVERPYAEMVAESLSAKNMMVDVLVVEPGEESKSIETASLIWEKMLEALIDNPDYEWLMIDASHIKVHPHGTGAVGGNQDMGNTKGGSTLKYIWPWMRMVCWSESLSLRVPLMIASKLVP